MQTVVSNLMCQGPSVNSTAIGSEVILPFVGRAIDVVNLAVVDHTVLREVHKVSSFDLQDLRFA